MITDGIAVGTRCRVIARFPGATVNRAAIFRFMGVVGDQTVWDARPLAGTQRLPDGVVLKVEPTADSIRLWHNA